MTLVPEAMAEAMAAEKVEQAFGLMGAGIISLVQSLTRVHGVCYHSTRHESVAVAAADGYNRATGRPGVCMVTWGPGLTNTATSLLTAKRARSGVVLVAGDATTASVRKHPFAAGTQGLNQPAFLAALGVPSVRVSPTTVAADVAWAFGLARTQREPVALLLPMEYLFSDIDWDGPSPWEPANSLGVQPNATVIAEAAGVLARAQRPAIIAGIGASRAGAETAIEELADEVGAVLLTSLRGKGMFAGHDRHLGIAGGFSPPEVVQALSQADVVAVFGAGLNGFTTRQGALLRSATILHCDSDPGAIGRHLEVDLPIVGDARVAAELIRDCIAEKDSGDGRGQSRGRPENTMQSVPRFDYEDISTRGAIDPRALCERLDQILPADRALVSDTGAMCEFPVEYFSVKSPDAMLWMVDFGAVGNGLGAGIGAAAGRPDRLTVVFVGDGGLMMTLGDLDTAVRSNLPLLVVCMNDRAYKSEAYHMREWGLPEDEAFLPTPDLAQVARSIGCTALRVEALADLDALPSLLDGLAGPLFLDCLLTQELLPAPLRLHT